MGVGKKVLQLFNTRSEKTLLNRTRREGTGNQREELCLQYQGLFWNHQNSMSRVLFMQTLSSGNGSSCYCYLLIILQSFI